MRLVIRIDRLDRASDRLRHHHHSRAAPERIIVAFQMLIIRIIADIHHVDFDFSVFLRPAQNTLVQCRKHLGKQSQYIYSHYFFPRFAAFVFIKSRLRTLRNRIFRDRRSFPQRPHIKRATKVRPPEKIQSRLSPCRPVSLKSSRPAPRRRRTS